MIHLPHAELQFKPRRPLIMGILNVTPDSFSDAGAYLDPDDALWHVDWMLQDGANIIDVGPESSRPGSEFVDAEEQIRRAVPVITGIRRKYPNVPISVDTRLATVARAALDAGADIINDISGLRHDPHLVNVVAERHAGVIIMHMQGEPKTMQQHPTYQDVVSEVHTFLGEQAAWAKENGIAADRIILDPGIGFGKTVEHNLKLMTHLERFKDLGYPVLLGASRKRFIAAVTGEEETKRRIGGSLACVVQAMRSGMSVVRVHDVRETRQMLDMLAAFEA